MLQSGRIDIPLGHGLRLTAIPSDVPEFPMELYVGITDQKNAWLQDLAIVMKNYHYKPDGQIDYTDDAFKVFVYGDESSDDYTNEFLVRLRDDL